MSRSYEPSTIVSLPLLSASAAFTLGEELRTAAKAVELPASISQAFVKMTGNHDALRQALGERLPTPAQNTALSQAADYRIDSVYSGTFDWCRGFSKIPEDLAPGVGEKARRLLETLFPDGLKFTQLPYKLQWADSQARVDVIESRSLKAIFDELGGGMWADAIIKAHEEYGKALGVTKSKPLPLEPSEVRKPYEEFLRSVRSYVVQVVAYADLMGESGNEMVTTLLKPLMDWQTLGGKRGKEEPAPEPTEPNPG